MIVELVVVFLFVVCGYAFKTFYMSVWIRGFIVFLLATCVMAVKTFQMTKWNRSSYDSTFDPCIKSEVYQHLGLHNRDLWCRTRYPAIIKCMANQYNGHMVGMASQYNRQMVGIANQMVAERSDQQEQTANISLRHILLFDETDPNNMPAYEHVMQIEFHQHEPTTISNIFDHDGHLDLVDLAADILNMDRVLNETCESDSHFMVWKRNEAKDRIVHFITDFSSTYFFVLVFEFQTWYRVIAELCAFNVMFLSVAYMMYPF